MKKLMTICLLAGFFTGTAFAGTLFDFENNTALIDALDDESGPVAFNNSGLVATFTASDGTMNITGSGFGLNSTISGDDTDAFDVGEWLDITFDSEVTLTNVDTASWSTSDGDEATIYVNGVSNGVITASGYNAFSINVPTGQVLRISTTAGVVGNGWWLDSLSVDLSAPPGNSAPVLAAIGDQAVIVSNELSFTVTATDVNGDDITLSATGLPSGAVFNTVTNAGAVTNIFIWTSAAPTGTWQTVFTTADAETNTSETITITVSEQPGLPDNVTFDFADDADLYGALDDQGGPITYTNNGLVATFTASDGDMNRTTTGFGINGDTVSSDDTDGFDNNEWIDITFTTPVVLTNINTASWTTNDMAVIYVDGTSNGVIAANSEASFDTAFELVIPAEQVLRIAATNGIFANGWHLESISVRIDTNAPPVENNLPVISPIGNKLVIEGSSLNFTVSATDINGDDIVLSATDLPPLAVFNTVTNAGAVTNTFSWTSATPVGVYTSTFYAADAETNTSETIIITVSEPSALMITEVADPDMVGGQYYRFVELYNNGNDEIDLAAENWTLSRQNGGTTWYDVALTGTVAAAETYIIASTTNFPFGYGFEPEQIDGDIDGNGDDAYFLYSGGDHSSGTLVDIYGEIDTDGTGQLWEYTDSRAARNATASGPSTIWTVSEWIITDNATTNDMNPGVAYNLPPVQDPIGAQGGLEGSDISFSVSASDVVDDDPITLSATPLPAGAVFTNGTLTWNSASPVGQYDVTFTATDKDGFDSEVVTITVIEKPLLLLSEIADPAGTGGGDYRFVELYNAGTNAIDLAADNWYLSRQDNGGSWEDVALTGTVAPTGVRVVAKDQFLFNFAYGSFPNQADAGIDGNGFDAYALFYGGDHTTGILIDIYGELDTHGDGTDWDYENDRAERNNPILEPNATWTASEWTITVNADTTEMNPGIHGPTPEFVPLPEDQMVLLGNDLSLIVTAVNTVKTDVITLSASVLPAGATFPSEIGTNTISSTLSMIAPTAGTYTVTFAADGDVDTTYATIEVLGVDLDADTDGDGLTNGEELIAGTDLYSSFSTFRITDHQIDGGTNTVNWYAVSDRRYTVLWTSSLPDGFQPIATNDAPTNSWIDTVNTTNDTAFYQLKVELIP